MSSLYHVKKADPRIYILLAKIILLHFLKNAKDYSKHQKKLLITSISS